MPLIHVKCLNTCRSQCALDYQPITQYGAGTEIQYSLSTVAFWNWWFLFVLAHGDVKQCAVLTPKRRLQVPFYIVCYSLTVSVNCVWHCHWFPVWNLESNLLQCGSLDRNSNTEFHSPVGQALPVRKGACLRCPCGQCVNLTGTVDAFCAWSSEDTGLSRKRWSGVRMCLRVRSVAEELLPVASYCLVQNE